MSSLYTGDTFPRNSYRKLFEAAQTFIEKGEHVANLILSEMYLNDENKFEETQMAEARLQQDPDAAVRTWQIFIYCRNRKVGIKSLNSRSPLRRDPSTRMNGREGASTSPSRAQHAPSGSPAGRTLSSSSAVDNAGTGNQPTANTNDTFPSLEMPPERIYRHAKDANCPGQISAFLQVDPRALSKSIW